MQSAIDGMIPSSMRVSLGKAIADLDECIERGEAWLSAWVSEPKDVELERQLAQWFMATHSTLLGMFVSKANALKFQISEPDARVTPPRAMLRLTFNKRCKALLDVREDLVDLRERISIAATDFADQLARHAELLAEIRETRQATLSAHEMTADIWQKVVAKPDLAPKVSRLLNLGIAQNAAWDFVKSVLGAIF